MKKNSKKEDGRGRSFGSRATQFSSDRQPERQRTRKQKADPDAAELLHQAIFEKIPASRNGKRVKIPFIEALINSMRKKALEARIGEQIKYMKELAALGVFNFEEYKERLFRGINKYYKKVVSAARILADGVDELVPAFKRSHVLYVFYFTAYAHARQHCTCGACDRGLDYAEFIIPIFLKAISPPDEHESEEPVDDDDQAGEAENGSASKASGLKDKDGDTDFYDGFGFD